MDTPERESAHDEEAPLGAAFPAATRERWRELVAGVLRRTGVQVDPEDPEPERLLAHVTYDDITIDPLYAEDPDTEPGLPGRPPFTRGARPEGTVTRGWEVRQAHGGPDPAATRRAIRADLDNGVDALWLAIGERGLPVSGIGEALTDTDLEAAPVTLDAGPAYREAAHALLGAWEDHGTGDATRRTTFVTGNLGIDPISVAARGEGPMVDAAAMGDAAREAAAQARRYPRLRLVTVDATPYHDAGGSATQELGASMASGVAYLRALTEAGLGLDDAARRLEFRYAASADQFHTIAKLRAARSMWNRVGEVCGLAPEDRGMRQHVVTSWPMMAQRDPHVNILRTTLACFGAGVGGAEAVTVRPFDAAARPAGDVARRIARNVQSLLVEESHLARVIDPAGGSYYMERLTAELHDRGWAVFQELEAAGGMVDALSSGLVAERVNEVWQRRRANLAHRRDPLTGVSEFPDLDEPPPAGEDTGTPARPERGAPPALPRRRYAAEFEALRDRSDARLAATGQRPRVFLATMGPLATHTQRATFASNLLRAGGIEPVGGTTTGGVDDAVAAFAASGARVACLCAQDAIHAEQAAHAADALRAAGAARVLIAGDAPTGGAGSADGVDTVLTADCDAITLLTGLHETLEGAS